MPPKKRLTWRRSAKKRPSARTKSSCTKYYGHVSPYEAIRTRTSHRKEREETAAQSVAARNKAKGEPGADCYKDKHCLSNWCEQSPRLVCIGIPDKPLMSSKSFGKYKRPNGAWCFESGDCISKICSKNKEIGDNFCTGPYMTPNEQQQLRRARKEEHSEYLKNSALGSLGGNRY